MPDKPGPHDGSANPPRSDIISSLIPVPKPRLRRDILPAPTARLSSDSALEDARMPPLPR